MTCNCHPSSPFHWQQNPRPSIFAEDTFFKAKQSAKTGSQLASEVVARKRSENVHYGTIYGSAREREDAVIRSKLMHIFSKAVSHSFSFGGADVLRNSSGTSSSSTIPEPCFVSFNCCSNGAAMRAMVWSAFQLSHLSMNTSSCRGLLSSL